MRHGAGLTVLLREPGATLAWVYFSKGLVLQLLLCVGARK